MLLPACWQVDGVSVDSKSVSNALRGAHSSLVEVEVRRPNPNTAKTEASSLGALFSEDAQALHVVQITRMSEDGESEDDGAEVENADNQARDRQQSLQSLKA